MPVTRDEVEVPVGMAEAWCKAWGWKITPENVEKAQMHLSPYIAWLVNNPLDISTLVRK